MIDIYDKENDYTYALGTSVTIEALLMVPEKVRVVYISSKVIRNYQYEKLCDLCRRYHIEMIEDDKVISKLSLKENCYAIGVIEKYQKEVKGDEHLVLYNFNDYGELGTIIRSAVSFDFRNIILINPWIDVDDPRVIRASMGSIFHCNIEIYTTLTEYQNKYNYNLYPFISNGKKELKELKIARPYSIIIPQNYYDLDDIFEDGYYLSHQNLETISLSTLSSVTLEYFYYLKRSR